MMKLPVNFKFQKKYLAFFTVVPLLLITTFVEVDCPVCDGTGIVSNSLGMENVIIKNIESEEIGTMYHACGMFLMYGYEVNITLENQGEQDAIGWLKLVLIDYVKGTPEDNRYTVVEVPANSAWEFEFSVWFQSNHDEKRVTEVKAVVLTGEVPDETCDGTGKIALNTYPLINNLKDQFKQTYKAEVPWVPPAFWEWYDDEDTGAGAFTDNPEME
jgi:hypothetical protein